jgi:hypothetical protein
MEVAVDAVADTHKGLSYSNEGGGTCSDKEDELDIIFVLPNKLKRGNAIASKHQPRNCTRKPASTETPMSK